MSSDFTVHSAFVSPPVQAAPPVTPPKPPKSQSDHKPVNEATTSRGPSVVLSGALARPPEKHPKSGQDDSSSQGSSQGQSQSASTGQHINHVI